MRALVQFHLLCFALSSTPYARPQDPVHRFARDKILVGLPNPMAVRGLLTLNSAAEGEGFAVDLIRAAAQAVGLEVEFTQLSDPATWVPTLDSGGIDVICPMSVTDVRLQQVDFSAPILVARGAVFSKPETPAATTAAQLARASISVARDGVAQVWSIERNVPASVEISLHEALEAVASGRTQYCVTTQIAGRVELERSAFSGLIDRPLEDERISRAFSFAVSKKQPSLLFDLNKGLAMVRDDGRWDQLYDKWVARYQPRPHRPYLTRRIVLAGGATLLVVMSLGLVGQWILRRRLARQTELLRQSEVMYRAIAESLPALTHTYFVADNGAREVRYISPQWAEWRVLFPFLRPGDDWNLIRDRIHPDDREAFEAATNRSRTGHSKFDMEFRLHSSRGDYHWIHSLVTPLQESDGVLCQGMLLDVTPLRAAEEALRASETKYRVIFDSSQDALLLLHPGTLEIRAVNESACKLYGRRHAELNGATLELVDGARALNRTLLQELLTNGPRVGIRDQQLRKDGSQVDVEISVASVTIGEETLVLAEVRDVSERVRAESERQRLEAQLFQSQQLEGLGVLAGGIAHDFNNLLGGILGNVDLARTHLNDGARASKYLSSAEAAIQRAADLTQQLLAYAGKARFSEASIDVGLIAREMHGLVAGSLHPKAHVHFELSKAALVIVGDATLVRQVVMNLITNASDALPPEGGDILIRSGVRHFDAEYLTRHYVAAEIPAGLYVFLDIEDTGSGMDEATLARMFDPFFTTKFTGRGLGLSVVFKAMQRHRGAVKVSSTPGQGTLLRLLFPPAAHDAALSQEPALEDPAASNPVRVLVVDDDPIVREVVSAVLQRQGWSVTTAVDGDDALRVQSEQSTFDVVLLDLTMPGRSGSATLTELQRQDPAARVVLMSGFEASPASDGEPSRASGFLQKPFTGARLVSALEEVLKPG